MFRFYITFFALGLGATLNLVGAENPISTPARQRAAIIWRVFDEDVKRSVEERAERLSAGLVATEANLRREVSQALKAKLPKSDPASELGLALGAVHSDCADPASIKLLRKHLDGREVPFRIVALRALGRSIVTNAELEKMAQSDSEFPIRFLSSQILFTRADLELQGPSMPLDPAEVHIAPPARPAKKLAENAAARLTLNRIWADRILRDTEPKIRFQSAVYSSVTRATPLSQDLLNVFGADNFELMGNLLEESHSVVKLVGRLLVRKEVVEDPRAFSNLTKIYGKVLEHESAAVKRTAALQIFRLNLDGEVHEKAVKFLLNPQVLEPNLSKQGRWVQAVHLLSIAPTLALYSRERDFDSIIAAFKPLVEIPDVASEDHSVRVLSAAVLAGAGYAGNGSVRTLVEEELNSPTTASLKPFLMNECLKRLQSHLRKVTRL